MKVGQSTTSAAREPGRRERKKRATRTAIRVAAVRLAVQHGVENVSTEQIAEEADVSLRTFFNHFTSKEAAVLAAAEERASDLITELRKRPAHEPLADALREATLLVLGRDDALTGVDLAALRQLRQEPSLLARQLTILIEQETALAAALAERRLETDPDQASPTARLPRLYAAVTLAALRVALDSWLDHADEIDETHRIDLLREEIDTTFAQLGTTFDGLTS